MYMNKMIVKLLDDQGFIEEEERKTTLDEFEASTKPKQNDPTIKKKIHSSLNHPLGALGVIFIYSLLKSLLNRLNLQDNNLSLEEKFKLKIKEDTYLDILNDMEK